MKKFYTHLKGLHFFKTAMAAAVLLLVFPETVTAQNRRYKARQVFQAVKEGGQPKARIAATTSKPLNSNNFVPGSTALWELATTSRYQYNSAGRKVSEVLRDAVTNQFLAKDSADFDAHGNEFFQARYNWSNNAWQLDYGYKSTYTYNSAGVITEELIQQTDNAAWVNSRKYVNTYNAAGKLQDETAYDWLNGAWVADAKYSLTYDAAGRISQEMEQTWSGSGWEPDYQLTYAYQAAALTPSEVVSQEFRNGGWENDEKMMNITWHNFENWETTAHTEQIWVNNAWVNDEQTLTTYDALGGYVETEKRWQNNAWVNAWRYHESYDTHLNYSGYLSETWNTNAWETNAQNQHLHTYNATNDLTQTVTKAWDQQTRALVNVERRVFSNFMVISGAKDQQLAALQVTVFPNPATNTLNIQLAEKNAATIQITDLTGRLVQQQTLPAQQTALPVTDLAPGLYLLRVQTSKGVYAAKFRKQ